MRIDASLRCPETIDQIVDHYIASRQRSHAPVSVTAAVKAITAISGQADRSEKLADLVAAAAVRHGLAVHFDFRGSSVAR